MSGKRSQRTKWYRKFVESGLAESDDGFKVALKESPRSIGSAGFRARVDALYQKRVETYGRPEDVSFRHISALLRPSDVLAILAENFEVDVSEFTRRRYDSALRAVASRFLIRYAGQTQREVADLLDMGSGAAVCNQLKRLLEKLEGDRLLRRRVQRIENQLYEARASQQKGREEL